MYTHWTKIGSLLEKIWISSAWTAKAAQKCTVMQATRQIYNDSRRSMVRLEMWDSDWVVEYEGETNLWSSISMPTPVLIFGSLYHPAQLDLRFRWALRIPPLFIHFTSFLGPCFIPALFHCRCRCSGYRSLLVPLRRLAVFSIQWR